MNLPTRWHEFTEPAALAQALADSVAADLRAALERRGYASIALSGGKTPRRFLEMLARCELDWSRVTVTLADERWVAADDPRSNERLLRETLLQATGAKFVPLYRAVPAPDDAVVDVDVEIALIGAPFDVIVLGMGLDGHTASLFPDGDWLAEALDPRGSARVAPMRAPGVDEPRMTLTLPVLVHARHLYLHIEGVVKRGVLESDAVARGAVPIGALLAALRDPLDVFWAP